MNTNRIGILLGGVLLILVGVLLGNMADYVERQQQTTPAPISVPTRDHALSDIDGDGCNIIGMVVEDRLVTMSLLIIASGDTGVITEWDALGAIKQQRVIQYCLAWYEDQYRDGQDAIRDLEFGGQ